MLGPSTIMKRRFYVSYSHHLSTSRAQAPSVPHLPSTAEFPMSRETATVDENAPSLGPANLVGGTKYEEVQSRSQGVSLAAGTLEGKFAFG